MILMITIFVVFVFFLFWEYKVHHWKRRRIPSLKASFPFGNIGEIVKVKKTIGEVYDDIYWKFRDEPVVGFYQFAKPSLMIRDPELIKSVFVTHFTSFNGNDYYVDPKIDPILGLNPFNLVGEEWIKARGVVTSSLTPSKIKKMIEKIHYICNNLKDHLRENSENYLECYDVYGKFTTDIIGTCAYGLDSKALSDPESKLREVSMKIFNTSMTGNIALMCALYSRTAGKCLRFKIISEEATSYFEGIIKEACEERKRNNVSRNDYLQWLMNANLENRDGNRNPHNYREMAAHCMTFFLDGFETTSILLGFIVYELSLNPHIQNELRNEITNLGSTIEDFGYDNLQELEYLDMVIKETLRKHPPGTSMARSCNKSVTIENPETKLKVFIEEGTSVTLPMYSLHNDPNYFPEPNKFDPLRFTKENIARRPEYSYFPFGGGPRSCPGYKFGLTMIKLAIVATILNFELEPKNKDLKIRLNPQNSFFHSALDGLWVKFKKL